MRLVGSRVHQARARTGLVGQFHLHHPAAAEGIRIDLGRVVDQRVVDLDDLARNGRVNVRGCLDGLDDAVGLAGGDLRADLGELDVDDVAELGLLRIFFFWGGGGGGGREEFFVEVEVGEKLASQRSLSLSLARFLVALSNFILCSSPGRSL